MYTILILLQVWLTASPSGQIAFVSGADQSDRCVFVVDVATRTVLRVGHGERDGAPVWSPDGKWLAFTASAPNGLGVYAVRPDGTERRQISAKHGWNASPVWALGGNGLRLAYVGYGDDSAREPVCVQDFESGSETDWGPATGVIKSPEWVGPSALLAGIGKQLSRMTEGETAHWKGFQPDAAMTLLATGMTATSNGMNTEILVVTPDRAVPLPSYMMPNGKLRAAHNVRLSPDGERIAFEAVTGTNRDIFIVSEAGALNITDHPSADWNPVWSPDSTSLAFESFRDGQRGVYRVQVESKAVAPVAVDADAQNWAPAWSPDGNWVAFVSTRFGNPEILIADPEGKHMQRITNSAAEALAPAWRPETLK